MKKQQKLIYVDEAETDEVNDLLSKGWRVLQIVATRPVSSGDKHGFDSSGGAYVLLELEKAK